MDVEVQPGTYVVAVSGGVDSIALLNILRHKPGLKLVVAHFDHGIRHDSEVDRRLVEHRAKELGLPFVFHHGQLGPGASEDVARKARYEFLHKVRDATGAQAIITAHHHDDALETAVLNMLRGTNRKGITALQSRKRVLRPMLHLSKQDIKAYAQDQGLVWREDATNTDTKFLRNYIRHKILPSASVEDKQKLKDILHTMKRVNTDLDEQLNHYLHIQPSADVLDRRMFIRLPHAVAREVMAAWLRNHGIRDFDQKAIERIVIKAKTLAVGKSIDALKGHTLTITNNQIKLS